MLPAVAATSAFDHVATDNPIVNSVIVAANQPVTASTITLLATTTSTNSIVTPSRINTVAATTFIVDGDVALSGLFAVGGKTAPFAAQRAPSGIFPSGSSLLSRVAVAVLRHLLRNHAAAVEGTGGERGGEGSTSKVGLVPA